MIFGHTDEQKKFIDIAKEVINLEIKALQNQKNINSSFYQAVISIAKCQSKVILCGVGKSGLIASKIAATLSVGTPSFFLSADSSHGDLGSVSKRHFDFDKLFWTN